MNFIDITHSCINDDYETTADYFKTAKNMGYKFVIYDSDEPSVKIYQHDQPERLNEKNLKRYAIV